MKSITVLLLSMALIVGCSKNRSEDKQVSQAAVEPDNSGRNVRDRNEQTKTAGDQSESEADRTISQNIRQAITADDSLSTNGKNVKIITIDGAVTLRGPVKSDKEKSTIGAKAQQIAGVKNVDNQLEITN
jgi:hyperosmotically inducible periplasmic protein